jgi:hypothetical protein
MTCIASRSPRGVGRNESGEEDSFLLPPSRKRQARSNYGEGSERVAGIPGENSGPFFSSSARRETVVAVGAIVRAGDGSMHSLEVAWLRSLLARSLARSLAWLAGRHTGWRRSMPRKFSRYRRRRNEDESTDGSLGSKIDSISRVPRGMYVRYDVYTICMYK